MVEKIPAVTVLKPITPSPESVRGATLRYNNLIPAIKKNLPHLQNRMDAFFDAEPGSIEEQQTAQQLSLQYMLLTAGKLQEDARIRTSEQLWSERYTNASSEIYGVPEAEMVQALAGSQATALVNEALQHATCDNSLVSHFVSQCEDLGINTLCEEEPRSLFEQAARQVGDHLEAVYAPVFQILEHESSDDLKEPEDIAVCFEAALSILANEYDTDWAAWRVERDAERDLLSVSAGAKKIVVGMNRAPAAASQLKGLLAHEILVHAQRGVNGAKTGDSRLEKGIPGYLGAEEGLGVFFEYAVTGVLPQQNIDRYVDIGLALGLIDGRQKTRAQMLDFVRTRAHLRNEITPEDEKKTNEQIEQGVYAHVNRIYRGSLGNEHIGIFTKDIAYQVGFMKVGTYIETELVGGKPLPEVIDYLLQGKFDPTNPQHVQYLHSRMEKAAYNKDTSQIGAI